jgi:multiple sugar transport system permease protein
MEKQIMTTSKITVSTFYSKAYTQIEKYVIGKSQLRIAGVLCLLFGVSELLGVLSVFGIFVFNIFLPWKPAMLSIGGGFLTDIGLVFAIMYIAMGVFGLLYNKRPKIALLLTYLAIFAIVFHIVFLILSFFNGFFTYISILFLAIPIIYLLGASLNTDNRNLKNTIVSYSFIAPNLVGFSIFTLIPMGFALALGFMHWNIADNSFSFVGLENFRQMGSDRLFMPSLRNTLFFTIVSVPLTMIFSLSLALLLNNKIRGRTIFRSIMFFPHVASLIAMAAVWNQVFHPSWGPVNHLLTSMGVNNPPGWMGDSNWALPTIIFFTAWRNMGYYMIIYLAGLQSIPSELYEAASIDGASGVKKFFYITLPQLRFVTFFVSVMLTIMSFRVFDQVIMLRGTETPGSDVTMLVVHIFRTAFHNWDLGYASAIALVLLGLVLAVTIPQFIIQRRYQRDN